jgi:hypothetical protein
MRTIKGTVRNGQIIPDQPVGWPDGCRVLIEPAPAEETFGIPEEDRSDSPDAVAEWLQWYESLEPLEMTAEEEAAWQTWRQRMKEHSIAKMHQCLEGLFE